MVAILDKHINVAPGICGGRPHIAGHRITVDDVVIMNQRLAQSLDEIAATYELSLASVYAAMAYYFDYKAEVDARIAADDALAEAMRGQQPSRLQDKLRSLKGG